MRAVAVRAAGGPEAVEVITPIAHGRRQIRYRSASSPPPSHRWTSTLGRANWQVSSVIRIPITPSEDPRVESSPRSDRASEPSRRAAAWSAGSPRLTDPYGAQADCVVLLVSCVVKVPEGMDLIGGSTLPSMA
ncbi:hypothetical protein GCM10029976_042970 [Kribbella albertanoniae]